MAHNEYAAELGRAWTLLREQRNDAAIEEFDKILRETPDQIDALYGLALAQRASHQREAAKQSFERCLTKVRQGLDENPGMDRYEMMQRFVHQRLEEMGA